MCVGVGFQSELEMGRRARRPLPGLRLHPCRDREDLRGC